MLTRRIIPCLDVKDGLVVKGRQFRNHQVLGKILDLAARYQDQGADELVFYDITASSEKRLVDCQWIKRVARILNIPFSVAGGIRSKKDAELILSSGADKVSINSPAIDRPELIEELVTEFGTQCVVVGIDSYQKDGNYWVWKLTGKESTATTTNMKTLDWLKKVQILGVGEIVLNCMNQDGMRTGYDISQLSLINQHCHVPLIASGGAGSIEHFSEVFRYANVDGALAASVFHKGIFTVRDLKDDLYRQNIPVRPC